MDSSNAAQRENEETKSESIAHTNAARVTRSTSAWKSSYWGGEDSDDDCDDLVGDHGGTAHRQPRRSDWCSYSSDEEWSDEKDEIWSDLDSDDDSYCPYQPLTFEEALRQIEDGKKTRLAGKKTDNPTLRDTRCAGMSGPVFGEWINEGTESLRPACEVGSGRIRVASVCFERRIHLTDQKSLVIEPNEIRTGSVVVLYRKGAESREMKVMAVDRVESYRAKMTPERCSSIMMPIQETLMRKNEAAEPSLVFNVSPGEANVQRVWVEYDVEMTVQMSHINWPERGLIESAVVRLNREAAAANFEQMSAERTTFSSEGCTFILEVPMELSQRTDETWEVESGKFPIQEVECVFKPTEALAGFKLDYVKQDNQNGMHVQKTEAEVPSHGVQTFVVDDELQWDPRHSTLVVRAASQCVPDRTADIQLTEGSGARLKRQVWTSLLWLMTALWVQVNVQSDQGTSWHWNVLPRSSKAWYHALPPSSVNWERAVSHMGDEDWMQHRHCLSSRCCCEATNWREGKATYTFEQSDRSWVRHKGNPGVKLMLSNTDCPNAKTSVVIVDMENSHSETIEKQAEVSRDTQWGQILEVQPLSPLSRTTFIKHSRICTKHPRHGTKMTSERELRETRCKSLQDRARESQLNASNSTGDHWRPSKCPTMGDEHSTARKVYDRQKMKLDGGDTGQVMRKAILTPEEKWFTYARAPCDYPKRPVSRRICDSGHCEAAAEQKRNVAVPSADSCSWISHRKHERWKAEEQAAQKSMKDDQSGEDNVS